MHLWCWKLDSTQVTCQKCCTWESWVFWRFLVKPSRLCLVVSSFLDLWNSRAGLPLHSGHSGIALRQFFWCRKKRLSLSLHKVLHHKHPFSSSTTEACYRNVCFLKSFEILFSQGSYFLAVKDLFISSSWWTVGTCRHERCQQRCCSLIGTSERLWSCTSGLFGSLLSVMLPQRPLASAKQTSGREETVAMSANQGITELRHSSRLQWYGMWSRQMFKQCHTACWSRMTGFLQH